MDSHNTKSESLVKKETIQIVAEREDVRVIKANLTTPAELSLSLEDDAGVDPYNSTGHHVILNAAGKAEK